MIPCVTFMEFFKSQHLNPLSLQPHPLRGWLEEFRSDLFQRLVDTQVSRPDHDLYKPLKAEIYEVHELFIKAVFASYEDGMLLWLDNHFNNDDFAEFLKRERIVETLGDDTHALCQLIIQTKLPFLGLPRLIATATDIPPIPEKTRRFLAEHNAEPLPLAQDVSNQIRPPILTYIDDGIELTFFIWTDIFGNIIQVTCRLLPHSFEWSWRHLAAEAGHYFLPR